MIELKPCPFCGCQNDIHCRENQTFGYYVKCYNCGSKTDYWGSKAVAIKRWNRRTYQPEEIESEFMRICEAQMEKEN